MRHRTLFWTLHSVWALATGIAVLILAHERYGFVPWILLFLGLTWASTLYFSRRVPKGQNASQPGGSGHPPALHEEVTSYLTRTMYQETLFFLIPFYWYSTVVKSVNVVFGLILGGLAVLSCLDLVFDRWLRNRPIFGLFFFATVAFAAVNLILPMLISVGPALATKIAIVAALGSAVPVVIQKSMTTGRQRVIVGVTCLAMAVSVLGLPQLVPPVPLRIKTVVFTLDLDPESLKVNDTLTSPVDAETLDGGLFVIARVFAPSVVPTVASMEWSYDGNPIRKSREVKITAHRGGFRIWDQLRSEQSGLDPGRYEVILRTGEKRVFGRAAIRIQ